ncbi:Omega-amidase nit3 [Coemansia sp. Benny D115]|nr:Omega-amidase nit3 [Coemansia sp. Benny D115]
MDKVFKLALVQLAVTAKKAVNLANARAKVIEAASRGAQLVVLPECFNSPYGTQYFEQYAEELSSSSESMQALRQMATDAKVYLIGGSVPEREPATGNIFNTCTVWNPEGELLAKHRKVHLFDINFPGRMVFKESEVLKPGNSMTDFMTPWGRVGLGICYDIRFPEMAMCAARRGCFMMVYPGAFNMTTGPLHWELLVRARAVDNQIFAAVCSPARDMEATYHAWGHSTVVDPFARVLATTDEFPDIAYADIDLAVMEEARKAVPVYDQRRFDLYPDVLRVYCGYGGYNQYGGANDYSYGGGGGQGFMGGQDHSNSGGGGGWMNSNTADGGGEDNASRGGYKNQTLRPVTIKQLTQVEPVKEDNPIMIDGEEIRQVTFIGVVRSFNRQNTNINYSIEDGTGMIDVRLWTNDTDMDSDGTSGDPGVKEGEYARVYGDLKFFNGKRHVTANRVRPVTDHNEIAYHGAEAIYVHLTKTRGVAPALHGSVGGAQKPEVKMAGGFGNQQGGMIGGGTNSMGMSLVQAAVMEGIKTTNFSPEGVSITAVKNSLAGRFQPSEIAAAVEWLTQEGHIYSTIDDNTFLPTYA